MNYGSGYCYEHDIFTKKGCYIGNKWTCERCRGEEISLETILFYDYIYNYGREE